MVRVRGSQYGDLPPPREPKAWTGVTHLQARRPLALAMVQSRPVALRPMLPTTVSRTYCLHWRRKEGGWGLVEHTTFPPYGPTQWFLILGGFLFSQRSRGYMTRI